MGRPLAVVDAGDFHFELHKKEGGEHQILRSDISDPAHIPEEVKSEELPLQVSNIFNRFMY